MKKVLFVLILALSLFGISYSVKASQDAQSLTSTSAVQSYSGQWTSEAGDWNHDFPTGALNCCYTINVTASGSGTAKIWITELDVNGASIGATRKEDYTLGAPSNIFTGTPNSQTRSISVRVFRTGATVSISAI